MLRSENLSDPQLVGVVGLGTMGSLVAAHIRESKRPVVGWDVRPEAVSAFTADGGIGGRGIAEVARAPVLISMVLDDDSARESTLGADGLVRHMSPGAVHVMMASISAQLSADLARAHEERGQFYLAAPVFGRAEAAAVADLTVLCSGMDAAFEKAEPVLRVLGRLYRVGIDPRGSMLVKSLGNSMIFTAVEMLREMFDVLRAAEVPDLVTEQVLIDGLFPGPIFSGYARRYREDAASLHLTPKASKDRRHCLAAAADLDVDLPLIRLLDERDLP